MDAPFMVRVSDRRDLLTKMRFDDERDARQFAADQDAVYGADETEITIALHLPGGRVEIIR